MNKINKILITISFLGFIPIGLIGPIYAIFVKNIGGDLLEIGITYGIFSIISGIFVFTVGRLDSFKKRLRQMVFLGFLILTIAEGCYLVVQNPWQLFMVQILLGIGSGILEPSWDGLFSANLSEEKAASFWSVWAGARDIATGLGAILGGVIVAVFSFKFLFIIMLFFNTAATLISLQLLMKKNKQNY